MTPLPLTVTEAWDALLRREVVTLCCYEPSGKNCHRVLLAEILASPRLGALYLGERPAPASAQLEIGGITFERPRGGR